ncbi:MAG: helix-turn-helix domain-containing protein, partial [Oscillospiraceae bacterium]|nr:helix-turn-helix domain-containing protein [Oscillospiraceae bacterium]
MILADKLIQLRKRSGMSQEELAEKMNVSRQAVSKWEGAQSIPDLDKILQLSELYGVTTDYLLKDSVENEEFIGKDAAENVRKVTLEEANEYLALRKTASMRIAIATFLCILSVIPLFILGGATTLPDKPISENMAGGLGMIIMLAIAAVAVGIFVYTGSQSEKYDFLEKESFETEYGVSGVVKERQKAFRNTYVKFNIIGTCLCMLAPTALFAA